MCAVPNMAVFCSSLTSCFPGMLVTYFLNDFEIVPVAPIITGIIIIIIIMSYQHEPTSSYFDFEIVRVAPFITVITLVYYIPHALYFYCKVFTFLESSRLLF